MKKRDRIILIDANALIHRSYHAVPPTLRTTDGAMVNAVYGFTSTLLTVLKQFKPRYVAAAFDVKGKTFRHKMYEAYKGTRKPIDDDLIAQFPLVKDVLRAMNIPILEKQGYEADDVIGTIDKKIDVVNKEKTGNLDVYIVTGDRDVLQLVDDDTVVYTFGRSFSEPVIYDTALVKEKFGITPAQVVDYKALRGDPSDNIPGVPGIGEKTAVKLIQAFGTLEALYAKVAAAPEGKPLKAKDYIVPAALLAKLRLHKDSALLSKQLATIDVAAPISFTLEKCTLSNYNRQKVVDLFQHLQFKSLLNRLPETDEQKSSSNRTIFDALATESKVQDSFAKRNRTAKYVAVDNLKALDQLVSALKKAEIFAFDTETTSIRASEASLVGMSFAVKSGAGFYVPVAHQAGQQLPRDVIFKALKPIFENPKIHKVGHHSKYDWIVLKNAGITVQGITFDTLLAAYVLDPGARGLDLDSLVFAETGYEMMPISALIGKGRNEKRFDSVPIPAATFYAAEDADCTYRLYEVFKARLKNRPDAQKIFAELEVPLVPILGQIERNGIELDTTVLKKLSVDFAKKITALTVKIYKLAGKEFNISSPLQLAEILFTKLQLPTMEIKKTKSGYSTAASELAKLQDVPIVAAIQAYREFTKLKSTYIDALPKLVNPQTGRLHTTFNQTIAATGRLSSTDPNLQNIPIRTEQGQKIRKAFTASRGKVLLALDYSQIELRIMAHLSKSPFFIKAFKEGEDIHRSVAAMIHGISPAKVSDEQRREAKIVNFAILYGVSGFGLSQQTTMDPHQARAYIEKYFTLHPEVRNLIDRIKLQAKKDGYVESVFGRRRYFPEIVSRNPVLRQAAERAAINMPFQGTNADIMKMAMIQIVASMPQLESQLLLQIHDELIFEVPRDDVEKTAKKVRKIMEGIVKLRVPLKVDVEYGSTWGTLKPLEL